MSTTVPVCPFTESTAPPPPVPPPDDAELEIAPNLVPMSSFVTGLPAIVMSSIRPVKSTSLFNALLNTAISDWSVTTVTEFNG